MHPDSLAQFGGAGFPFAHFHTHPRASHCCRWMSRACRPQSAGSIIIISRLGPRCRQLGASAFCRPKTSIWMKQSVPLLCPPFAISPGVDSNCQQLAPHCVGEVCGSSRGWGSGISTCQPVPALRTFVQVVLSGRSPIYLTLMGRLRSVERSERMTPGLLSKRTRARCYVLHNV